MGDLVVDLTLLEQTDHSLGVLYNEFKDASAIVIAHSDEIGSPTLLSALEQFATDWNAHRDQLLASIQSVRELASQGHTQFRGTDEKLARELRTSAHHGGRG